MNYIVFDLEWNQPMLSKGQPPLKISKVLPFEIFQIGAVKLNDRFEIIDEFRVTIKLRHYKKLHYMVKKMVSITSEEINQGVGFEEAAQAFCSFCGEDFALITWGYDDIPILKQNCTYYKIDSSWCDRWYNLQVIFNTERAEGKNQRSLEYAMERLEIPENGQLHDAFNDAYYTALVAQKLNLAQGLNEYSRSMLTMRPNCVSDVKSLGVYQSKEMALESRRANEIHCPVCGELLSTQITWTPAADGKYRTVVSCDKHGSFRAVLWFKRHKNGFDTTRTVKVFEQAKEPALAENE